MSNYTFIKSFNLQHYHANIINKFVIKKLRPVISVNDKDPNHANYD